MIAIIDYGAGNLQSVYKALRHIGAECKITSDREEILGCDGAILPGVGSFGDTMDTLNEPDITSAVKEFISTGKPFLGICLGLQLLFPGSEESPEAEGLGILEGRVRKIPSGEGLKIPHMGWNSLRISDKSGIFDGIEGEPYVYFVHSYYLKAKDSSIVSARTEYGTAIDAAVHYKNVSAVQFHPEKSGDIGLKMLKNFALMCERQG